MNEALLLMRGGELGQPAWNMDSLKTNVLFAEVGDVGAVFQESSFRQNRREGLHSSKVMSIEESVCCCAFLPILNGWICSTGYDSARSCGSAVVKIATREEHAVQLMLFPPEQLKEHLSFSLGPKTLVQGQMLLVVACCILWLDPLVEIYELSNDSLQKLRIAVFLVWAAVQISLVRPLMQAYFHGALVQWYNLRHFGGTKKDENHISKQIQMKVMVNTYIACKVAIQVLGPSFQFFLWIPF
ncbi:hypothetical protein BSKO_13450 [Bryopsis sp. KO-2023]|nr:hypothetical protein BSKO_13450 [Bryopsis sp. KO-2023]